MLRRLLLALLLFLPTLAHPETSPARPNILWLVSEDNGRFLGCYGDPLAHTPTLDQLAKNGVLYERCFAMPVCAPSRFTLITGLYPVTSGPAHHMRAKGSPPPNLQGFPALLRNAGFYTSNHSKTDYNCPLKLSEIWDGSHYKNRPPHQPFFSVFNHEVTHESCLFPTKEIPTVDPAKISVPPYQPDTPEIRADWARYYSHIAQLDSQIAAKLQELATAGLAEDTIIFYYSDNGGVLPRSKRFLHESGTHVPLIVYYPPKWQHLAPAPPGSRIKDPVHFIDFAPTVLSLLGIPIPDYFQGHPFAGPAKSPPQPFVFSMRDRMDESFDTIRSVADSRYLYIHNYRPDRPYVPFLHYMFQARGYQSWARLAQANQLTPATAMFWGEKPPEELYDSLNDPHNIHNLATDPAQLENLQRFRQALEERVIANCDNGFLPEGSPLEGFAKSHAPNAYPIQRVFALANLASQRLPANLPTFIQSLSDPSEPIRWWAAQGCAILGPLATPAKSALLSALHDPSPAVQIAAAESLARLGLLDPSLPILALWATQSAHPPAATQAGNVLAFLGPAALPILPALKESLLKQPTTKGENYPFRILSRVVDLLEKKATPLAYPTPTPTP